MKLATRVTQAERRAELLERLNIHIPAQTLDVLCKSNLARGSSKPKARKPASSYRKPKPVITDSISEKSGGFTKATRASQKRRILDPRKLREMGRPRLTEVVKAERAERKSRKRLRQRDYMERVCDKYAKFVPTPEEIAEGAAAIRAGWTDSETEKRCQFPAIPVELAVVHVP